MIKSVFNVCIELTDVGHVERWMLQCKILDRDKTLDILGAYFLMSEGLDLTCLG